MPVTPRRRRRAAACVALPLALAGCGTLKTAEPGGTATSPTSTATSIPDTTEPGTTEPGTSTTATTLEAAAQLAALEAAERQWDAAAIDDYRFTLVNDCFCSPSFTGPILVVVVDGAVDSMTLGPDVWDPAWAGSTVPMQEASIVPGTAEALFARIRQSVGQKDFRAAYDEATGFPIEFYSDPLPGAADDEYGFHTAAFAAT